MSTKFQLEVKSTLDRKMKDIQSALLAQYPPLKAVDIDNIYETEPDAGDIDPTLLWQFSSLDPNPKDPLYVGSFLIGVKTTEDAGNYELTALLSELTAYFAVELQIPVGDYSGASAVLGKGVLNITSVTLSPQQYDKLSGIRLYTVAFMGQRFI